MSKTPAQLDREIAEALQRPKSVGYEVSRTAAGKTRSAVFTTRKAAKKFQAANPGSQLHVVGVDATGRIVQRGRKAFHATKREEHPSGVEWSDLAPTGIRVETHSGTMPLEEATAVEIRRDMNRRLSGYRALAHVPARRKKWALAVYELAQAKPWVMDQVPHDVWGLVLADIGRK